MTDSTPSYQLSWGDPLTRALACAALSPGLGSLLLFDTTLATLRLAAQILTEMLEQVAPEPLVVRSVTLSTFDTEERLWGSLGLLIGSEEEAVQWQTQWQRGLLTAGQEKDELGVVVIPDLTRLSLAAARACVTLMGADVAHFERHGQQASWKPRLYWLAGCASKEVGAVSPHLLDRFALRLSGAEEKTSGAKRVAEIQEWLKGSKPETPTQILSAEIGDRLVRAKEHFPEMSNEATERILAYTSRLEAYSHRREITLGRLTWAHARLDETERVSVAHVERAAKLMGLPAIEGEKNHDPVPRPLTLSSKTPVVETTPTTPPGGERESVPGEQVREPVYTSPPAELQPEIEIEVTRAYPYKEDREPVLREAASLRLPTRQFRSKAARGPIVGVEKAAVLRDLALVRTLLEAAKFQSIRRQSTPSHERRLILSPKDLYCYRRAPVAEQMLVLLLDHTCLRNCNWEDTLLPYLSWAYVERASICLIQVGAQDARHELRAEKITGKNILVPRISTGIEAGRGKATPLAHGLDLALQTLRHALQHGRSTVKEAVLLIISDGRGNVPLEASYLGRIVPPVGRQGVEDALEVAERLRGLERVKAVLLDPQPKEYRHLPQKLAQALGATVIEMGEVE